MGPQTAGQGVNRQVLTEDKSYSEDRDVTSSPVNLLDCLLSPDSEDDSDVCQVRISDRGSRQLYADVQIVGVPARGVIDSGSDITIMGGELFRHIATVARLRKNQFHKPDKTPRMYDGRTFTLYGKMDLDITFNENAHLYQGPNLCSSFFLGKVHVGNSR